MHSPHSIWNRKPRPEPWLLAHSAHPRMESLGAAAAISQFLIQFIATVDLAKRIKGSSKSLRQYQEQLEDLRALCEDISGNPALSTDEVQRETESILHTIGTHKDVSNLLQKGRIYRSIAFILKEKSFGDLFATLETKKTNLSLRVQNVSSLALHDIHLHVTSLSRNTPACDQLSSSILPPSTMTWQQPQDTHRGFTLRSDETPQYNRMAFGGFPSRDTPQTAEYSRNYAGHNVHQHLGHVVCGRTLTHTSQWSNIEPVWDKNRKQGDGDVVNGLTYQPTRGSGSVLDFVPVAPGRWVGNKHMGTENGYGQSKQIFGTLVID